ncbi:hypothetical protein QTP88_002379 [Uroleucon formosanum]
MNTSREPLPVRTATALYKSAVKAVTDGCYSCVLGIALKRKEYIVMNISNFVNANTSDTVIHIEDAMLMFDKQTNRHRVAMRFAFNWNEYFSISSFHYSFSSADRKDENEDLCK